MFRCLGSLRVSVYLPVIHGTVLVQLGLVSGKQGVAGAVRWRGKRTRQCQDGREDEKLHGGQQKQLEDVGIDAAQALL